MNQTETNESQAQNKEELSEEMKKKMEEEEKFQRRKLMEKLLEEAIADDYELEEMRKITEDELRYTDLLTAEIRKILLGEE